MSRRATLLSLVALAVSGCGVTQVVDETDGGVPILIRSPQPDADDLEELHDRFGVQTVVNLRGEKPGESWFEEERRGVEAIGARWVHLRTSGKSEPSPELVQQFFELVQDRDNWPIVVHCQGGIHRTGLWSALYRIQYQGWAPDQAIDEMEELYFDWTITDREAIKRWLRHYRRDPDRQMVRRDVEPRGEAAVAATAEEPAHEAPTAR